MNDHSASQSDKMACRKCSAAWSSEHLLFLGALVVIYMQHKQRRPSASIKSLFQFQEYQSCTHRPLSKILELLPIFQYLSNQESQLNDSWQSISTHANPHQTSAALCVVETYVPPFSEKCHTITNSAPFLPSSTRKSEFWFITSATHPVYSTHVQSFKILDIMCF